MNTFSTAAALVVLTATAVAYAAQTQKQSSSQSGTVPNAATSPYQYDPTVSARDSEIGDNSGAVSCQLKREALKDTATSTAFTAAAAQDGMVEVALAGLALRKTGDDQIRQL
ncbi:MAG TPA: hypothetical protein VI653_19530, partial [Steroidobacteraceae bacterium]